MTRWHDVKARSQHSHSEHSLTRTFTLAAVSAGWFVLAGLAVCKAALPPREMERLGRGVVVVNQGGGQVFVSWRWLGTDPEGTTFNLYRAAGNASPVKLNAGPLTSAKRRLTQPVGFIRVKV